MHPLVVDKLLSVVKCLFGVSADMSHCGLMRRVGCVLAVCVGYVWWCGMMDVCTSNHVVCIDWVVFHSCPTRLVLCFAGAAISHSLHQVCVSSMI